MSDVTAEISKRWYELLEENSETIKTLFMKPVLYEGEYFKVDGNGGTSIFPEEFFGREEAVASYKSEHGATSVDTVDTITGSFARMSASGYMDATDYMEITSVEDAEEFFRIYVEDE